MTVLNFTVDAALPAEFALLLVVLEEAHCGNRNFVRIEDPAAGLESHGYRYADDDAEHSFVFGKRGKSWRKNSLSSDAEFVYWKRTPKGTDEHLILSGGSFVQVDGGIELHCTRPVQWAEVMAQDGVRTIFSSDEAAFGERRAEIQQSESPRAE